MKKVILLILVLSLSSCGIFRSVEKHRNKEVSSSEETSKTTELKQTIDRSVITENYVVDTIARTPAKELILTNLIDLSDFLKGVTIIDSGYISISQVYDKQSKSLKTKVNIKPQDVPVKLNKTKKTENNIITNTDKKIDSKKEEDKKSVKVDVKKEPTWKGLIVIGVVIGLILALTYTVKYFISKKVKKDGN